MNRHTNGKTSKDGGNTLPLVPSPSRGVKTSSGDSDANDGGHYGVGGGNGP